MKKILIIVLSLGILGAGYWLISPFWRVEKVSEGLPTAPVATSSDMANSLEGESNNEVSVLSKGSFTGFDKIHTGSGTAHVLSIGGKNYIRFEEDFDVNNGPDLYVGLGENGEYIEGSELGKLKGTVGSQNYELPAGIDPASVQEVWIWCKAFSVPFAMAVLK